MLMRDSIEASSEAFGVTANQIKGRGRHHRIIHARTAAIAIAHMGGKSFSQIGRVINRTYSPVRRGFERAIDLSQNNREYAVRLGAAMKAGRDDD